MAKWSWEAHLAVGAVLLIYGPMTFFAAVLNLLQGGQVGGVPGPTFYIVLGAVATAYGVLSLVRALMRYSESQRNAVIAPNRPRQTP